MKSINRIILLSSSRRCCSTLPTSDLKKPRIFQPDYKPAFDGSNRTSVSLGDRLVKMYGNPEMTTVSKKSKVVTPPKYITNIIHNVIEKEKCHLMDELEDFVACGEKFTRFRDHRSMPLTGGFGRMKFDQVEKLAEKKYQELKSKVDTRGDEDNYIMKVRTEMEKLMNRRMNRWKSVDYDRLASLTYLLGSVAAYDYACLLKVFKEIRQRNPEFLPRTMLDFGSGVGTVTWAVKEVLGKSIYETINVEPSRDMNDLHRMILSTTFDPLSSTLPSGFHFRLQLPRDEETKYDLVVSAFTFLEFRNHKERLNNLHTLWERVEPGGFLVLTEVGSTSGFFVLAEARNYLMELFNDPNPELSGYIYAPCPHEYLCPRVNEGRKPCLFDVRYKNFPFKWAPGAMNENIYESKFTYLIARKGMTKEEKEVQPWSRVIEQPLVQKKHIICRLCTERGKLEEIFSKKALSTMKKDLSEDDYIKQKALFKYAKSLKCGDRAQFILDDELETTTDTDDNDDVIAVESAQTQYNNINQVEFTNDKHKPDLQLEYNPEHQPNN